MMVRKAVNQRIEDLRKSRGLTQAEFAERLGLEGPKGRSTVNNWEQGLVQVKSDDLIKISKTFSVSADYLLGLREEETNDINAQAAIDYTGLSSGAIDTIREVNFAFGNNEEYRNVSSGFFSLCWRDFVVDLAEMLHAINYVWFIADEMDSPEKNLSIGVTSETIENLERELKIALFSFSERCRLISDRCGGREALERIQSKKRFLNNLILEREGSENGQHFETAEN